MNQIVTVAQLIKMLEKAPQNVRIELYYDGGPRLVPNLLYLTKDHDDKKDLLVLGQNDDIYSASGILIANISEQEVYADGLK